MSDSADKVPTAGAAFSQAKRVNEVEQMRIELAGERRKRNDLVKRSEMVGDEDTKQTVSNWIAHETGTIEARLQNEVKATEPHRFKDHIEAQKQKFRSADRSLNHPAPRFVGGSSNPRAPLTNSQMRKVETDARKSLEKENTRLSLRIELGVCKSTNEGLGSFLDRQDRQKSDRISFDPMRHSELSKSFNPNHQPKRRR